MNVWNCHQTKQKLFAHVADVTNSDSLKGLVDAVITKFGHLDVLVNNAGGGAFSSIFDPKLMDTLDHMINLDVKSVVALTQLAAPHLEKTKGTIVNISSILGQRPVILVNKRFNVLKHT